MSLRNGFSCAFAGHASANILLICVHRVIVLHYIILSNIAFMLSIRQDNNIHYLLTLSSRLDRQCYRIASSS